MMHFTCDQCGKEMRAEGDPRYAITIDVRAAHDVNELTDDDFEDDHMEAISALLRDRKDGEEGPLLPPPHQQLRFDLCPDCHERYLRDPLGKELSQKLTFSEN